MGNRASTNVLILGTAHFSGDKFRLYIERLEEIIKEISPDIICGEISPEKLSGQGKPLPEYRDVILPFSEKHGIKVIPLEPGKESPVARYLKEGKEKEMWDSVKSTEFGVQLADYYDKMWDRVALNMEETLNNTNGFENLQGREFDLYFSDLSYFFDEFFLPEFATAQKEWDQHFLMKINEAIMDNPNSLILVTVGLRHKNWLWQQLESRDDIILYNLHSFREAKRE
jgi:hypothetical protein